MKRCIDLAKRSKQAVKTNPNVGAVLVYDGRVIGEGRYTSFGGPHAEINAINSVRLDDKEHIQSSTLYVSLEPCCIHSKTPPCLDRVLEEKIPHVVIGCTDPNPSIAGRSISALKQSGVDVTLGILEKECKQLIAPFTKQLSQMPYVILKWAQSSDAYIGKKGQQVWISNDLSKQLVHQWRTEIDGLLVGFNTAQIDNPQLNVRLAEGPDPVRLVIDPELETDRGLHLWDDKQGTIFITQKTHLEEMKHTKLLSIKASQWNWRFILESLFEVGIYRLMIEGGSKTLKGIINENLWDEARIITSNQPINGGIRAPFLTGQLVDQFWLKNDRIDVVIPNK